MKSLLIVLTALLAMVQAAFIDDVYKEINRIRRQNGESTLHVDTGMEKIMKRIRYTENHNHSQKRNLEAYNTQCTGWTGISEILYYGSRVPTIYQLFHNPSDSWMYSPGHKREILRSTNKAMACASQVSRGRVSVVCAFRAGIKASAPEKCRYESISNAWLSG